MKTNDEWLKKSKRLLKDIQGIPSHRLNDGQSFDFTLFGPGSDGSWSELDVIERALEHFICHLQGKNPCLDSVPVYIVSKEKGRKLEKSGKARRLGKRIV